MKRFISATAQASEGVVRYMCMKSGAFHVRNGYVDVHEPLTSASDGVWLEAWFDSAAWTGAKPVARRHKVEYWG